MSRTVVTSGASAGADRVTARLFGRECATEPWQRTSCSGPAAGPRTGRYGGGKGDWPVPQSLHRTIAASTDGPLRRRQRGRARGRAHRRPQVPVGCERQGGTPGGTTVGEVEVGRQCVPAVGGGLRVECLLVEVRRKKGLAGGGAVVIRLSTPLLATQQAGFVARRSWFLLPGRREGARPEHACAWVSWDTHAGDHDVEQVAGRRSVSAPAQWRPRLRWPGRGGRGS